MYIKILLITCIYITCNAYEALQLNNNDIKELNTLDEKIYKLSTCKESFNFTEIANYIYRNLNYKIDYNRLLVEVGAVGRTSAIQTGTSFDKDKLAGTITLSYPIFDMKETNEIKKKMIDTKQTIIKATKSYFILKAELQDLHVQKEVLFELETRAKARKLTAVGSFDDWTKIIDSIRKINAEITKAEIELSEAKQNLLSYVHVESQSELERML